MLPKQGVRRVLRCPGFQIWELERGKPLLDMTPGRRLRVRHAK